MKGRQLRMLIEREPLAYAVVRQSGSHAVYKSPNGFPRLIFAFHDGDTIGPGAVKKVLTGDIGLTITQAQALL